MRGRRLSPAHPSLRRTTMDTVLCQTTRLQTKIDSMPFATALAGVVKLTVASSVILATAQMTLSSLTCPPLRRHLKVGSHILRKAIFADMSGTNTMAYHVREDRAGESPTASTAQAHFGPEACIFVAKYVLISMDHSAC